MKALKTKVILSAAVLFFALVATIGSTYAWFTVSSTNTVEAMTLNVQTANSLLIRPAAFSEVAPGDVNDASKYFTTITAAQMVTAGYDYTTYRLLPVTAIQTGYATIDGSLEALNILTTENTDHARALSLITFGTPAAVGAHVNNATTGRVIVLKFWVMTQTSGMDLYLQNLIIAANPPADVSEDEVINAIKLSAEAGLTGAKTGALIYGEDPDYDYTYAIGLPGYCADVISDTHFNNIEEAPTYSSTTLEGLPVNATVGDVTDIIAPLTIDTPTLVTITIFLEGWDAETTNGVIAADFTISFTLGIN